MSDSVRRCDCGLIEQLLAQPGSVVVYDARMNEYSLKVGQASWLMEYCFSCGGRLPESRRGEFFRTPSAEEVEALRRAMDGLKTAKQVVARLGEPDDTFERPAGLPAHPKETVWVRQLRYTRLWESLDLVVLELPNGGIQYLFSGKEKSAEATTAV